MEGELEREREKGMRKLEKEWERGGDGGSERERGEERDGEATKRERR